MAFMNHVVSLSSYFVTLVFIWLVKGYRHRCKINELRKQGLPMAEDWSWITGHLRVLGKYSACLPQDAFVQLASLKHAQALENVDVYLMDYWPVYPPLLHILTPELANQVSTQYNLPKAEILSHVMKPITGGPSMLVMNTDEWKKWRGLFNPGFSAGNMLNLIPEVVDSTEIYCAKLRERVGGDFFRLDDLTTRLTMDVILKLTLDADFDYQRVDNKLAHSLRTILAWHSFWDPRVLWHPLRPIIQWYYGRILDSEILREIQNAFTRYRGNQDGGSKGVHNRTERRVNSVIGLALEAYIADYQKIDDNQGQDSIDPNFARYASHQIRLFLFAGNDTTSSTLVYAYHMLFKHPESLARLRGELNQVFSPDPASTASALRKNPALINQCHFTLAVIKETLRLYSPASTSRKGIPGVTLTDSHGRKYPMDFIGANIDHPAMHLNPRLWPDVEHFIPDRWLITDPTHELYPVPGAFRPFELGPRNCIGQTLALNELRVALIMTAREINIQPAYEELDSLRKQQAAGWWWTRGKGNRINTVNGDRAYQTDTGGAHPSEGYPCRVTLRDV